MGYICVAFRPNPMWLLIAFLMRNDFQEYSPGPLGRFAPVRGHERAASENGLRQPVSAWGVGEKQRLTFVEPEVPCGQFFWSCTYKTVK